MTVTDPNAHSRRRLLGLAGAGALGTAATALTAGAAAAAEPTLAGRQVHDVRVLMLNLWFGGSRVPGGVDRVVEIVRRSGASIVLLAESNGSAAILAERLGGEAAGWRASGAGSTAVVARAEVLATDASLPSAHKAVLRIGGRRVAVYACHLQYQWYACYLPRGYGAGVPSGEFAELGWEKNPAGPITDVAAVLRVNAASGRTEAMRAIVADAEKERAGGAEALIGGDFNEPSHRDWTAATKNTQDHNGTVVPWTTTTLLEKAGYVDAFREQFPDPVAHPGSTWPASNPDAEVGVLTWTPTADERDRIDFIFAGRSARLRRLETRVVGPDRTILRSARVKDVDAAEIGLSELPWPSDHKGVVARYRLS